MSKSLSGIRQKVCGNRFWPCWHQSSLAITIPAPEQIVSIVPEIFLGCRGIRTDKRVEELDMENVFAQVEVSVVISAHSTKNVVFENEAKVLSKTLVNFLYACD